MTSVVELLEAHEAIAAQVRAITLTLAQHLDEREGELDELRHEFALHRRAVRRELEALRESIAATDRVLNARTAHLA
jgi:hypothetical protein